MNVSIKLWGEQELEGFLLETPFESENDIIVLTGLNGCGKTRLLKSIRAGHTKFEYQGDVSHNCTFIEHKGLIPKIGSSYQDSKYEQKRTASLSAFNREKKHFDGDFPMDRERIHSHNNEVGIPYKALFDLCWKIAKKIGKKPSELSEEEFFDNYEDTRPHILGENEFSLVVNEYIKKIHENRVKIGLNLYDTSQNGMSQITYLDNNEFINEHGRKPWLVLNEILAEIFNNKFQISLPNEDSRAFDYQATLLLENGTPLNVTQLSSGETTLLWLALTLFNTQHQKSEAVNAPNLLLFDEPDAFLHPKMIVEIFKTFKAFSKRYGTKIILTTHSPTTVALAPDYNVFVLEDNVIKTVSKDIGIASLLDGVNQIAINPDNRRQVYVESHYDAEVYQTIYSHLLFRTNCLKPEISLTFLSAGSKVPKCRLINQSKKFFDADESLIDGFINAVNGEGTCEQVVSQVEALIESDNKTVRGIIDWDNVNRTTDYVIVLAEDYAYTIENILLDPICICLLLHIDFFDEFPVKYFCKDDVTWQEWICDKELLQNSVDMYIEKVIGRKNNRDYDLFYLSGIILKSDIEYIKNTKGHEIEDKVIAAFPRLQKYKDRTKGNPDGKGSLKNVITKKIMINMTQGAFIPKAFVSVISKVQN